MIDLAKKLNMAEDVRRYMANRGDSDSDEEMPELVEVEAKPKWDCESIISTYSNLYNRPKVVDDDGFSVKSKLKSKRGNRKVMFGSALKELEEKYQEERSEMRAVDVVLCKIVSVGVRCLHDMMRCKIVQCDVMQFHVL